MTKVMRVRDYFSDHEFQAGIELNRTEGWELHSWQMTTSRITAIFRYVTVERTMGM